MKNKNLFIYFITVLLLFGCAEVYEKTVELGDEKGHLVIIGGGPRPDRVMKRFAELASAHDTGIIVVIPTASSVPLETGPGQAKQIAGFTDKEVSWYHITKENINSKEALDRFNGVGGIFFSGGSQVRLTALLTGTGLLDRFREIYRDGGVLGGTSAGAAIMSDLCITGDEYRYEDRDRLSTIEGKNVATTKGFGFIKGVIIDQHFVKRQRENRLISLVIENPDHIGVGIDEETAIVRKPDNTFEVIGNRSVLIFDAVTAVIEPFDSTESYILSAQNMKFHILKEGDIYSLKKLRVIQRQDN